MSEPNDHEDLFFDVDVPNDQSIVKKVIWDFTVFGKCGPARQPVLLDSHIPHKIYYTDGSVETTESWTSRVDSNWKHYCKENGTDTDGNPLGCKESAKTAPEKTKTTRVYDPSRPATEQKPAGCPKEWVTSCFNETLMQGNPAQKGDQTVFLLTAKVSNNRRLYEAYMTDDKEVVSRDGLILIADEDLKGQEEAFETTYHRIQKNDPFSKALTTKIAFVAEVKKVYMVSVDAQHMGFSMWWDKKLGRQPTTDMTLEQRKAMLRKPAAAPSNASGHPFASKQAVGVRFAPSNSSVPPFASKQAAGVRFAPSNSSIPPFASKQPEGVRFASSNSSVPPFGSKQPEGVRFASSNSSIPPITKTASTDSTESVPEGWSPTTFKALPVKAKKSAKKVQKCAKEKVEEIRDLKSTQKSLSGALETEAHNTKKALVVAEMDAGTSRLAAETSAKLTNELLRGRNEIPRGGEGCGGKGSDSEGIDRVEREEELTRMFKGMTMASLKPACKARGLKAYGRKEALVASLVQHDLQQEMSE